jgi:carbamoyl-phosphate synthase small subunit
MTQTKADKTGAWDEPKPTALLVLADGTVLEGFGLGATGRAVGEVCRADHHFHFPAYR